MRISQSAMFRSAVFVSGTTAGVNAAAPPLDNDWACVKDWTIANSRTATPGMHNRSAFKTAGRTGFKRGGVRRFIVWSLR
jgi:hypothetical protein